MPYQVYTVLLEAGAYGIILTATVTVVLQANTLIFIIYTLMIFRKIRLSVWCNEP